jgi:hypothetical protein
MFLDDNDTSPIVDQGPLELFYKCILNSKPCHTFNIKQYAF